MRETFRPVTTNLAAVRLEVDVPFARVRECLLSAKVVALPVRENSYSGATTTLLQGMACARPAVAVDSLGPAEIIEDGRTGWLVEPDEQALAAALVEVLENPGERERRGRAAREDVRRRYAWPRVAAQLAEVLDAASA